MILKRPKQQIHQGIVHVNCEEVLKSNSENIYPRLKSRTVQKNLSDTKNTITLGKKSTRLATYERHTFLTDVKTKFY